MYIKKIIEYNYNYAEYLVSDGCYDMICVCMSVPLPNGKEPKIGMKIQSINTFNIQKTIIQLSKDKFYNIEKGKSPLEYNLTGMIIDLEKALIKIGNLIIEIEENFNKSFKVGDFVTIKAERLDCYIE